MLLMLCYVSGSKEVNGIKWAPKEMSCLFVGLTGTPFDDLDVIDQYEFQVGGKEGFPFPLMHHFGRPERYNLFI